MPTSTTLHRTPCRSACTAGWTPTPPGSFGYRYGYMTTIVAIKDEHQRWQVYAQNRLPDHSLVVEHLNPPP
ncbi:hypothetical protein [Nannocystis pusilla]|uniref:hypothetical protein n=1 Tax=Nannocystis pusilla TaxID=889268 RepID=UPI003B7C5F0D